MSEITINQDTLLGVFDSHDQANQAIDQLQNKGYPTEEISVIVRDVEKTEEAGESASENIADGIAGGAATGGLIGAIAGLLTGVGAIAIPGFGGLLVGGPLAAALGLSGAAATTASGAITGLLAGGIVGGLVGLGVPEEEAAVYEERLKEGAVLLAVPVLRDGQDLGARQLLEDAGATQIRVLEA